MTLYRAIIDLVMMKEHPMMPSMFYSSLDKIIETISEYEESEQKKGKWITSRDVSWMCSECGKWLDVLQGDVDMNFCPNCGSYNGDKEE